MKKKELKEIVNKINSYQIFDEKIEHLESQQDNYKKSLINGGYEWTGNQIDKDLIDNINNTIKEWYKRWIDSGVEQLKREKEKLKNEILEVIPDFLEGEE